MSASKQSDTIRLEGKAAIDHAQEGDEIEVSAHVNPMTVVDADTEWCVGTPAIQVAGQRGTEYKIFEQDILGSKSIRMESTGEVEIALEVPQERVTDE